MVQKLIHIKDVPETLLQAFLAVVTVFCHPGKWSAFCTWLSGIRRFYPSGSINANAAIAADVLYSGDVGKTSEVARQFLSYNLESRMQVLDQHLRGRWVPEISVEGAERIENALSLGKGVILWVSPFLFSDVITKMGIAAAGYRVYHLSRPAHGYSGSCYGIACLNRIRTKVEERYVEQRVILEEGDESRIVMKLRRFLRKNEVISITVLSNGASQGLVRINNVGFRVSTGPLRLSATTGAPLLPVFTMQQQDGSYNVIIEEPLLIDGKKSQMENWSPELDRFAGMLKKEIVKDPAQLRYAYIR